MLDIGDSIETGATTMVVRAVVEPEPEPEPEPVAEAQATPAASARAAPTVFARVPVVEETPAEQIPPPALKLEIDFDAREARIALGEGSETVRLVFADGVWRVG